MSKGNRYHESVWVCLRELYKASHKESVKTIREELAKMLGIDVPSESAISQRIKTEVWERIGSKQLNFSSKTLQKKMQKKYSENQAENEVTQAIEGGLERAKNRGVSASRGGIEKVFRKKAFLDRKTAQVILEHRKRGYVLGQLFDSKINEWIDLDHKFKNFKDYFNTNPPEFEGIPFMDAFSMLHSQVNTAMRALGMFESLSTTTEKLVKIDYGLYGILPDDTREPESEGRIIDLDQDHEYYEEQQRISREKQKEIAERMALLQSGVFEEQVRLQAQQQATNHQLDNDIEDDEFDEILD